MIDAKILKTQYVQKVKNLLISDYIVLVKDYKHKNVPHFITVRTVQKCGTFAIIGLLCVKSLLEVHRAGFPFNRNKLQQGFLVSET